MDFFSYFILSAIFFLSPLSSVNCRFSYTVVPRILMENDCLFDARPVISFGLRSAECMRWRMVSYNFDVVVDKLPGWRLNDHFSLINIVTEYFRHRCHRMGIHYGSKMTPTSIRYMIRCSIRV